MGHLQRIHNQFFDRYGTTSHGATRSIGNHTDSLVQAASIRPNSARASNPSLPPPMAPENTSTTSSSQPYTAMSHARCPTRALRHGSVPTTSRRPRPGTSPCPGMLPSGG
jgi:hypothetical protein